MKFDEKIREIDLSKNYICVLEKRGNVFAIEHKDSFLIGDGFTEFDKMYLVECDDKSSNGLMDSYMDKYGDEVCYWNRFIELDEAFKILSSKAGFCNYKDFFEDDLKKLDVQKIKRDGKIYIHALAVTIIINYRKYMEIAYDLNHPDNQRIED